MTRLPKLKISWRRGKQYTSPVTIGGSLIQQIFTNVFVRKFHTTYLAILFDFYFEQCSDSIKRGKGYE